ncbi:MAG: RagB/SusD family nutrient uptake outer membrane protein [Dysgonamonadaceae bacterium]|jgi:hypothetical protein|nr:RagB/SusD family nutrient uptake outer membrane protein [Dysgonamonadaceae bacterium]
MKKYFYSALIALVSAAFYSCGDDSNLTEAIDTVPVPTSTSEASTLVNAVYGPLQTLSSSYSFFLENATETTVCFEDNDDVDGPQISEFKTKKDNWYAIKIFNRLYSSITAANTAIEKIGEANADDIYQAGYPAYGVAEVSKDLLIARAKFVRGYDYFQLVQFFGEVPVFTSIKPSDSEKTTRVSIDEVYAQVVKDLTDAIQYLPEYDGTKSNPTQLAAKAILAKVYLTWGAKPLSQSEVAAIAASKTDPAKPAVDAAKYAKAIEYADAVITSGKYALQADFNNIWGVANENNQEVIYSILHYGDAVDAQGNHQTHCGYTHPGDERSDPHIQYADITLEDAIPDGDARKLRSYAKYVYFNSSANIDTLTWPLSVVRPGKWIHGYVEDGKIYGNANQPNDIDHIDFRLAEIYLIKAEAQWYTGSGDKGLAAINVLRNRAGVDALAAVSEEAIRKEWGYELAFEQKHWLNLVRWRTLLSSIELVKGYEFYKDQYGASHKEHFSDVTYNGIPADVTRVDFYNRIYKHLHSKTTNADGHFYRFPIPLAEDRTTDLGITPQNPGY